MICISVEKTVSYLLLKTGIDLSRMIRYAHCPMLRCLALCGTAVSYQMKQRPVYLLSRRTWFPLVLQNSHTKTTSAIQTLLCWLTVTVLIIGSGTGNWVGISRGRHPLSNRWKSDVSFVGILRFRLVKWYPKKRKYHEQEAVDITRKEYSQRLRLKHGDISHYWFLQATCSPLRKPGVRRGTLLCRGLILFGNCA